MHLPRYLDYITILSHFLQPPVEKHAHLEVERDSSSRAMSLLENYLVIRESGDTSPSIIDIVKFLKSFKCTSSTVMMHRQRRCTIINISCLRTNFFKFVLNLFYIQVYILTWICLITRLVLEVHIKNFIVLARQARACKCSDPIHSVTAQLECLVSQNQDM